MKWISVKDKLPTDEDSPSSYCPYDYFFLLGENPDGRYLMGVGQFRDNKWEIVGRAGGYSCIGQEEFLSEYVTHWMINIWPEDF